MILFCIEQRRHSFFLNKRNKNSKLLKKTYKKMNKSLILNEIKNQLKLKTKQDFASFLGIKQTTLSMWYKRNTFDIELLYKKCNFLNPNWLLTGEGEMLQSLENPNKELEDLENQVKKLHKYKDKYYSILEMNSKLMKKNIKLLEKLLDTETKKKIISIFQLLLINPN